jgi:hypothetical protein
MAHVHGQEVEEYAFTFSGGTSSVGSTYSGKPLFIVNATGGEELSLATVSHGTQKRYKEGFLSPGMSLAVIGNNEYICYVRYAIML